MEKMGGLQENQRNNYKKSPPPLFPEDPHEACLSSTPLERLDLFIKV